MSYIDELRAKVDPSLLRGAGDFEAKLTFEERCQILALSILGYKRPVLAAAYRVVRPTIGYIERPSSPHYRNVRQMRRDLGDEEFVRKYVNADVLERVKEAAKSMESQLNDEDYKLQRRAETESRSTPNKRARAMEGLHQFNSQMLGPHSVRIDWLETAEGKMDGEDGAQAFHGPGWYVVFPLSAVHLAIPDATEEMIWPGSPGTPQTLPVQGPFITSQMALRAYKHETPMRDEGEE